MHYKVLIVDDDHTIRKILAKILSAEVHVIEEHNGTLALERCHWEADIDLIILDISMPEMDGYAVLAELRKNPRTAQIPVIFVTSLTEQEEEAKGINLGAVDFIRKPVHSKVFLARVRSHLKLRAEQKRMNGFKEEIRSGAGLSRRKLAAVKELIESKLDGELSVDLIANSLNLSPTYFSLLFKQCCGVSPHQYIIGRRNELAKKLLTETELPLSEIAARSGYSDQSHLTRAIRKSTGMTPRMLRERMQLDVALD